MDEALIQEQERQLQKTGRYYKHIFWLCVPLLCMACYFYGARPLLLCGIALLTGNLCDRLVALLRHRVYTNKDLSNESFSLIIALLMPATVDIYVLVVAVLAGVLIGKEVFGGYGSYPFNPRCRGLRRGGGIVPEQVVRYPQPYTPLPLWNASAVPVSSTIEDTLRSGGILNLNSLAIALGEFADPHGHRRGAGHSGLRPCAVDPEGRAHRCIGKFSDHLRAHRLLLPASGGSGGQHPLQQPAAPPAGHPGRAAHRCGAVLRGVPAQRALHLCPPPAWTHPVRRPGGCCTMGFRYFGVYETGVCFALLAVNSVSALIDRTEERLYRLLHRLPSERKEAAE